VQKKGEEGLEEKGVVPSWLPIGGAQGEGNRGKRGQEVGKRLGRGVGRLRSLLVEGVVCEDREHTPNSNRSGARLVASVRG